MRPSRSEVGPAGPGSHAEGLRPSCWALRGAIVGLGAGGHDEQVCIFWSFLLDLRAAGVVVGPAQRPSCLDVD